MIKENVINFINSRYFITIKDLKSNTCLKISDKPIEEHQISPDTTIETYECYCEDGTVKVKGAKTSRVWHELSIGYVTAFE